jgi:hypothetical protein
MAMMLVRMRLNEGNGFALQQAIDEDPDWLGAKAHGLRFKQVYVDPSDTSDVTIVSGWKSTGDADAFRREHLSKPSIAHPGVDATMQGEIAVIVATGVKG